MKELEKVFKVALPSRVVSDKHRDMGTNQPVGRLFVDEVGWLVWRHVILMLLVSRVPKGRLAIE